ncbi:hypothetical protein ID866_10671 [Astraeus odoratus]|nr:hypothetical protein ID866_10671 [Astraeus odoratus]
MCKSSTIMDAPAKKIVDWTKVLDEELVTDIDNTDLRYREQRKRDEKPKGSARQKRQKNARRRRRQDIREKQKWKDKERKQGACLHYAEVGKQELGKCIHMYQMHKAGAYVHHTDWGQEAFGVWVMCKGQGMMEHKKWVKKAADKDEDDKIIILSGWNTKWQGGDSEHGTEQWEEDAMTPPAHGGAGRSAAGAVVEELQEPQGEESGGQEGDTEGVPGGVLEGEPEEVLGNELEDGAGAEDGTEEDAQKRDKGKGKGKAL